MRVIFARLSCVYSGRVDASLSLGDYLLLLRDPAQGGDGSCLVYSASTGLGARNWMPPGSSVSETPEGFILEHLPRDERLRIYIERRYWEMPADPLLEGELVKMGTEREFSDLIAENLSMVEPGLTLVAREAQTPAGPVDLLCTEGGRPVAIEVKRRRITPSDAWQLRRYLHALDGMPRWSKLQPARGILLAPVLAKKAKQLIDDDPRLSYTRLAYSALSAFTGLEPEAAAASLDAMEEAVHDETNSSTDVVAKPVQTKKKKAQAQRRTEE